MTSPQQPNIAGFWGWFADRHLEILEIMGGRRQGRITDIIDHALIENGLHLTYEITEGVFGGELTFTPEGDPDLASFIDRLVAVAPSFDTWVVHARRQRKTLGAALAFVKAVHEIDVSDARFKIRYLDHHFHLCFLHDGLMACDQEKRYTIAATFLDHALGEDIATNLIGQIEFRPGGEGIEMGLMVNQIVNETRKLLDETPEGATEDLPSTVVGPQRVTVTEI